MTCADLRSATFSQASEDGPSLFDWLAGQTTGLSGLDPAPASLSARPVSSAAPKTNGTFGPSSPTSSASAALQLSLENRLRARLAGNGSPLFALTWKHWDMPSGPPILARRASAHRTSGSGCGGWVSPQAADANGAGINQHTASLCRDVRAFLASPWATPAARDYRLANAKPWSERGGGKKGEQLNNQVVHLAGWPSTTKADAKGSRRHGYMNDGWERAATNHRRETLTGHAGTTLTDAALLVVSGPNLTGCPAATGKTGQLNPAHSRWLMGYPAAWDACAPTATRSSRKSRPSS